MDAARFAKGLTYEAYKAQMTRNKERLEASEKAVVIDPASLAWFKGAKPLKAVALAEDWCGDVIANLPVLGVLARESGTVDLRVFLRDQNEDLAGRWLNRGQFKSIPVFAFFDESFRELGVFVERPASVTDTRAAARRAIYAASPEFGSSDAPIDQLPEDVRIRLQEALSKSREQQKPADDRAVLLAIRDCVARAPVA